MLIYVHLVFRKIVCKFIAVLSVVILWSNCHHNVLWRFGFGLTSTLLLWVGFVLSFDSCVTVSSLSVFSKWCPKYFFRLKIDVQLDLQNRHSRSLYLYLENAFHFLTLPPLNSGHLPMYTFVTYICVQCITYHKYDTCLSA